MAFTNNDKREDRAIRKVMKESNVKKGSAIAILKSKGVLKQKPGKQELLVKKKKKKSTKKK